MVNLGPYFSDLQATLRTGDAREESFYSDLSDLLTAYAEENSYDDVRITTLPRQANGSNPDFRVWNGVNEVTGYIEAKTFDSNLDLIEETEQLERYRATFDNVILTNFLEFRLYRYGEEIASVEVADPPNIPELGSTPEPVNTFEFDDLLDKFFSYSRTAIDSAEDLAVELAKRTSFMRGIIIDVVEYEINEGEGEVYGFYQAFDEYLMADLDEREFADIYSQTITYGLLIARTRTEGEFTRERAASVIPPTIGVLRDIFRYISAGDLPSEIEWIVDEISHILNDPDIDDVLSSYYTHRRRL